MLETLQKRTACWSADDAAAVFRTEALEGVDAIFLATHTPIQHFKVDGSEGTELQTWDEKGLLDVLSQPRRRHAFCVVQGEPGSGKSHLIRWLYVNWNVDRDVPLLLQRSDGSLEGALRQLEERLPKAFKSLFERLGQRQKLSPKGQGRVFANTLAALLEPGAHEKPLEDEDWCARWDPSRLIENSDVRRRWSAPGRIIELVSGAEGNRGSASARFNVLDVAELVEILAESDFMLADSELALHLFNETDEVVTPQRDAGASASEIVKEFSKEIPFSIDFIDALNRRRNDAIQNLIGISSEGLRSLFRDVRQALAKDGRRLVLCLEDITSWEGLDESLIDVLVTNATTREAGDGERDLCDLVSIVGVTPEYYRTLKPNYRDRITHEINLGEEAEGVQDIVTLRDPVNRLQFVVPYLAATRAGVEKLETWRKQQLDETGLAPPNICDECEVRPQCFASFGSFNNVGLFPFTAEAIEGFYNALQTDDFGRTLQTPRGIIQKILSPTLKHPDALREGRFPGAFIEVNGFKTMNLQLTGFQKQIIEARAPGDEETQNRLRRLLVFWGAEGRAETLQDESGRLLFNNVPRVVFDAFALPWLGDDKATEDATETGDTTTGTEAETAREAGTAKKAAIEPETKTRETTETEVKPKMGRGKGERKKPPRPRKPKDFDLEDLRTWVAGERLRNENKWNQLLYEIFESIDHRKLLVSDHWVWKRFLTPSLVVLEDTVKADRTHLVVPRSEWVHSGLEAFVNLKEADDLSDREAEFNRVQLARMIERLKSLIRSHVSQHLSSEKSKEKWVPATTVAQVLLVRAWLRGAVKPDDSTGEQWVALLSDETEATSNPQARTQKWRDFLEATHSHHEDLRRTLREMTATPQSSKSGRGATDCAIAPALVHLMSNLQLSEVCGAIAEQSKSTRILEHSVRMQVELAKNLQKIVFEERSRIHQQCERIFVLLRGSSIAKHVERVEVIFNEVTAILPGAAPDRIRSWQTASESLKSKVIPSRGIEQEIEDDLLTFGCDADDLPSEAPKLLSCLIAAKAGALATVSDCLFDGESTAKIVLENHVDPLLAEEGPTSGNVEKIHEAGRRLRKSVEHAISALEGEETRDA